MLTAKLTLAFTLSWNVVSVSAAHGDDYAKTMGPVAFLWPPDREWGAAQDNTPPCGSASGVVNRTQFPMSKQSDFRPQTSCRSNMGTADGIK